MTGVSSQMTAICMTQQKEGALGILRKYYVSFEHGLLVTLLDPRFKLDFSNNSTCISEEVKGDQDQKIGPLKKSFAQYCLKFALPDIATGLARDTRGEEESSPFGHQGSVMR
ncbi:hypothetical protein K3495_g6095 [Podosphaera aphanis]|nr:hypothetical protein K3495_g6095 [Podosphaera aphanis]